MSTRTFKIEGDAGDTITIQMVTQGNTDPYIRHNGATGALEIGSATDANLILQVGAGAVYVGDASNTANTRGLTLNQAATTDEILSLKSAVSDHGMTTETETDTYGSLGMAGATVGGLAIRGYGNSAGTEGLALYAIKGATDPDATIPAMRLYMGISNGSTGYTSVPDATAMFQLVNNTTPRLTVLGSGKVGILTNTPRGALEISNGEIMLTSSSVGHGMTTDLYTDNYAMIRSISATDGGMDVVAASDTGSTGAFSLTAIIGSADPTDTVPAIDMRGGKKDTGTSWQALGAAETVLRVRNYTTDLLSMLGDGTISLASPTLSFDGAASIDTSGNAVLTVSTGTAHLDITTGLLDVTGGGTFSSTLTASSTLNVSTATNWQLGSVAYTGSMAELNDLRNGSTVSTHYHSAISSSGNVFIGDTANIFSTQGLTINQGSATDAAISLKLLACGHGVTDKAEADTYAYVTPLSPTAGGLSLVAISDADATALQFHGIIGATNPTDSTPAVAVIGSKRDGTTNAALAAAETVFQVSNYSTGLLSVLGSGEVDFTGTYLAPVKIGSRYLWDDGSGALRANAATPSSASDGIAIDIAPDSLTCSLSTPLHLDMASGTTWSMGWWQSTDSNWWLLIRASDVSSFTRADADGYIPIGNIADVPTA